MLDATRAKEVLDKITTIVDNGNAEELEDIAFDYDLEMDVVIEMFRSVEHPNKTTVKQIVYLSNQVGEYQRGAKVAVRRPDKSIVFGKVVDKADHILNYKDYYIIQLPANTGTMLVTCVDPNAMESYKYIGENQIIAHTDDLYVRGDDTFVVLPKWFTNPESHQRPE